MQAGVLDADRQAESGTSGAAHPRRVGPPEPAEHQLLLAGAQADAEVANRDRDGVLVGTHPDLYRLVFGVVDGVGDQIAQDAFDTAGVDLGDDRFPGHLDLQLDAGLGGEVADVSQRFVDRQPQVYCLHRQFGDTGVVAGDLQQVVEQCLEPVQLTDEQLGGTPQRRVEILAVVVDEVGGHPDGRQGGAQFVADVGGEPPLQVAELFEGGDLALQALGHVVERHRQAGHIVFAANRHPLGQVSLGEPLGDPRRRAHRQHHLPRHQKRDAGQQEQQHQAAGGHGSPDQGDGVLLAGEREDQIQLEIADP